MFITEFSFKVRWQITWQGLRGVFIAGFVEGRRETNLVGVASVLPLLALVVHSQRLQPQLTQHVNIDRVRGTCVLVLLDVGEDLHDEGKVLGAGGRGAGH